MLEECPPTCAVDEDEVDKNYEQWRIRLNSRCRDLLQVSYTGLTWNPIPFQDYQVDFLHRTVRDFLRDNYFSYLHHKAGLDFDTTASLCKISLNLVKSIQPFNYRSKYPTYVFQMGLDVMYYSRQLELRGKYSGPFLLDELDEVMAIHGKSWGLSRHWTNALEEKRERKWGFQLPIRDTTFLGLAVQLHLVQYVTEKLDRSPELVATKGNWPLLDFALRPWKETFGLAEILTDDYNTMPLEISMVMMLLERGTDPNEILGSNRINGGQTIWSRFVKWYDRRSYRYDFTTTELGGIIECLLNAGADPQVTFSHERGRTLAVDDMIQTVFGQEPGMRERLSTRLQEIREARKTKEAQIRKPPFYRRLLGWM